MCVDRIIPEWLRAALSNAAKPGNVPENNPFTTGEQPHEVVLGDITERAIGEGFGNYPGVGTKPHTPEERLAALKRLEKLQIAANKYKKK